MTRLFQLSGAVSRSDAVEEWLDHWGDERGIIARRWFGRLRECGRDVEELLHDGMATACVKQAAFAYVAVFKAHVNVGFFNGAALPDPAGLLVGEGKHMRHVKLRPGVAFDDTALDALIAAAYRDIKAQLRAG